jgi:hypothetical protein
MMTARLFYIVNRKKMNRIPNYMQGGGIIIRLTNNMWIRVRLDSRATATKARKKKYVSGWIGPETRCDKSPKRYPIVPIDNRISARCATTAQIGGQYVRDIQSGNVSSGLLFPSIHSFCHDKYLKSVEQRDTAFKVLQYS